MYTDVIADILERAATTSVGLQAALTGQGDIDLQNELQYQAQSALRRRGINPYRAAPDDLYATAAALRSGPRPQVTEPQKLSRIFRAAAYWLDSRPSYGPAELTPGDDIVEAVGYHSSGRSRLDALTVIAQAVPAQTITDWEWTINTEGTRGAVELLLALAADPPVLGRVPHPDAPPPVFLHIGLDTAVIGDLSVRHAAERDGVHAADVLAGPEERRTLTRGYQEAAAGTAERSPELAEFHQTRADELRHGL